MRKPVPLLCLLAITALAMGGCWPWDDPYAEQTPQPTTTPPKVEQASHSSPSIEGRLLYARDGHIWLRTGTSAERLTEGLLATQPCWSPDGTQIAFIVKGEAYSDLWIMNADGSNQQRLTNNRSDAVEGTSPFVHDSYWAFQPQWMPPFGDRIGYISHSTPQNLASVMSVWTILPDGSGEQLYYYLDRHIETPSWSPDGQILVFVYFTYDKGSQLRYANLNVGGSPQPFGEDVEGIERYDAIWSPDGQWITYAARQAQKTDLWLMPSPLNALFDGDWSPVRLTSKGTARGPAWSPNGRQIVFVAEENNSFDLWILNLDYTEPIPHPTKVEKLTDGFHVDATARPSWAP